MVQHTQIETDSPSLSISPPRAFEEMQSEAQEESRDAQSAPDELREIWSKPKTPKYNKDGSLRKPRSGWGPYRSVVRERAVAFNLQLDVQNLQQEVKSLTTVRDVLRMDKLAQNQLRHGALLQLVQEYFHVFKAGTSIKEPASGGHSQEDNQRAFLHKFMDAEADICSGLKGPDALWSQFDLYSRHFGFLSMTMHAYDIVAAEDSVVISASTALAFQIERSTIEKVFPHVQGEPWVTTRLVGQVIEPQMDITFYFNAAGKCCKLDASIDFVGAISRLVKDPEVVAWLLGRALIADNCLLGLKTPEETQPAGYDLSPLHLVDASSSLDMTSLSGGRTNRSLPGISQLLADNRALGFQVVDDYFAVFAKGYAGHFTTTESLSELQRQFLQRRCIPQAISGGCISAERIARRWQSLGECFSVLAFYRNAMISRENSDHPNVCIIQTSARYILRLTPSSIHTVFPHIVSCPRWREALQGKIISVSSDIKFSIDVVTGRVCGIAEQMDFSAAMAKLVGDAPDAAFVLSGTKLPMGGEL